jgi:hypothetical protein
MCQQHSFNLVLQRWFSSAGNLCVHPITTFPRTIPCCIHWKVGLVLLAVHVANAYVATNCTPGPHRSFQFGNYTLAAQRLRCTGLLYCLTTGNCLVLNVWIVLFEVARV